MAPPPSALREHEAHYPMRVAAELSSWPDLTFRRTRRMIVFSSRGGPVLRLTGRGVAYLRLSGPVLDRLVPLLPPSWLTASSPEPGWVPIRLDGQADAELLLSLVSVAIMVNS
ncbi:hypothetical protein HNP84_008986 [Thermocatellispora tengchongensis]|uniref:Uncharacterized protein n=1 Tax=Thermocatellispora tengchongensis TaxID=1073253 RepID=A0A840PMJ0_9ACTN|nr:luciferase family protein [Thermocatellispora tengchongensis]MBB5139223.1 hypothetical protein [Thermocatellispora tengchongensis]